MCTMDSRCVGNWTRANVTFRGGHRGYFRRRSWFLRHHVKGPKDPGGVHYLANIWNSMERQMEFRRVS